MQTFLGRVNVRMEMKLRDEGRRKRPRKSVKEMLPS